MGYNEFKASIKHGIKNVQNYISQFWDSNDTVSVRFMDTQRNVSTRTGHWRNFVPVCHRNSVPNIKIKYCK